MHPLFDLLNPVGVVSSLEFLIADNCFCLQYHLPIKSPKKLIAIMKHQKSSVLCAVAQW